VDRRWISPRLRIAVERSFNRVTVDGDMSTNDSIFMLANGRSGVAVRPGARAAERFDAMLGEVTMRLAHLLVKDGEGATAVMHEEVRGARSTSEAEACARQVASSLLVKTMLAGRDPNVGRIAAAAGASGARFDAGELEIGLRGAGIVVRGGAVQPFDAAAARRALRGPLPTVSIDLHAGTARAWVRTCDLTEEYVRINARYST
jgi:glutamate N-acetyltransferase/amino-acid N-acetyltransferase